MNNDEMLMAIDANDKVLVQYQVQMDSLKQLRAGAAEDIVRLRRGDDVREILIASYERRQSHWDADVKSMEEMIEMMRANQKKLRQSIAG